MQENVISVAKLCGYIKRIFDSEELLHNISVYGEVSGLSISRGIAYFNLKDEDAMLPCVYFGINEELNNGDKIIATGTPGYYVKGGKLNFNVLKTKPYGLGEIYQKFLETKNKLEKEGLFLECRKKPLPKDVRRIGVVSSETGAVIQDIINVATRRDDSVDIVLYPAKNHPRLKSKVPVLFFPRSTVSQNLQSSYHCHACHEAVCCHHHRRIWPKHLPYVMRVTYLPPLL